MPAKTKARNLVQGWPRGRSTSAPWDTFNDWVLWFSLDAGDQFKLTTEKALESEYRLGQQKMADDYRARYRTLTNEDKTWLRNPGDDPLRDAMKESFYKVLHNQQENIPLGLLVVIKQCAEQDQPFWNRFRIAQVASGR